MITLVLVAVVVALAEPAANVAKVQLGEECTVETSDLDFDYSGWYPHWEWVPPGYVCVYTDRAGRVVGRRRP